MTQLSPKGLRAVGEVANCTGFTEDAVTSMLFSVTAGRGSMAQFSHPEFGGSGQWMAGGPIKRCDRRSVCAKGDRRLSRLVALACWQVLDG